MIAFLRTARKLVLGETWMLPIAVALAVGAAAAVRAAAGTHGWWHHDGGFVLLALILLAFTVSTRVAGRAFRRRKPAVAEWPGAENGAGGSALEPASSLRATPARRPRS